MEADPAAVPVRPPADEARLFWRRLFRGPSAADRIAMWEELRALAAAGIGVREAVAAVASRASGARRTALAAVSIRIAGGMTPGEAFVAEPAHVPPSEAAMVEAYESTGRLDAGFSAASAAAERSRAAVRAAVQAAAYPLFLLHFALFIPGYVILQSIHRSRHAGTIVLAIAAVAWLLAAAAAHWCVARRADPSWARRFRRVPFAGAAFRQGAAAAFCEVLAAQHDGGVPLDRAIERAGAAGDGATRAESLAAADRVRRGDGATASLCAITALPAEAPSLLASGEASGELSAALRNIAVLERDRAGASVRRAGVALRTLLMGAAVLAVAWLAFSVFSRAYRF